jgi:hypothetical protein
VRGSPSVSPATAAASEPSAVGSDLVARHQWSPLESIVQVNLEITLPLPSCGFDGDELLPELEGERDGWCIVLRSHGLTLRWMHKNNDYKRHQDTKKSPMSSRFTAVTYNILARSLGSSVIPWVLTVSHEAQALVDRVRPGFKIKEWVKSVATAEYKRHFHRNHASGDKDTMRSMWSAAIDRQEQVPMCLKSVACVGPDTLQYPVGDVPAEETYSSELHVAVTLRGLLRREFDRDVADQLFKELVQNEEYFLWENRGPEIFETVTSRSIAELFPGARSENSSDLITLLEV